MFCSVTPGTGVLECDASRSHPSLALVKHMVTSKERSLEAETPHPDLMSLRITPDTGHAFTRTVRRTVAMDTRNVQLVLSEPVDPEAAHFTPESLQVRYYFI